MVWLWTLFIVLHAVAIGFMLLSLWRLHGYIKRYKFDESKYTLLFRFVHLHWVLIVYAIATAIWIPVTYLIMVKI